MSSARATPLMQQHAAAKRAHPDAIVFFRLGDFYEMFEDDAVLCSRLLELTLTSRNKGKPDEVPMAGVPHHAAHGYVVKLLELGYKVALCEQLVDPSTVKGIVPREVTRVLTPGTVTGGEHLDTLTNNWLASIDVSDTDVGVALFDVSTAELRAARFGDLAGALGEMARSTPREIVVGTSYQNPSSGGGDELVASVLGALGRVPVRADGAIDADDSSRLLGALAADALALGAAEERALGRVLRYARACSPGVEFPVRRVARWDPAEYLVIDATAKRHLELTDSMSGGKDATLLGVIDETATPAGARLLRRRLLAPLVDVARIRRRLDAVGLFVDNPKLRAEVRLELASVGDIERQAVRATLGEATPRDLGALRDGLAASRRAASVLSAKSDAFFRNALGLGDEPHDTVLDVEQELARTLVERPPALAREGALFLTGFDAELDEADGLKRRGSELMVELEARLREETGAPIKVRYTRVFGWYVEVTRTHAGKVPKEWRRKQTVAGAERFTLPELEDLADRISHAEERHRERELALFAELVARVKAARPRIVALSESVARWDVASSLAEVAHRYDYCRPEVDASESLEVVDARHPVVERLAAAGRFVPNDICIDTSGDRMVIVTGPNMAGKSTLLRQVALLALLAQMGSFVPAKKATVGIVDRVLSRVGASDNLARGESTFMVEMSETAEILRKGTSRSLVILDEIGRGTSTFDGLAIAWAVAEYLDDVVQCRTLFATHYHELTAITESSEHAVNMSVSAEEVGTDIVFLHRLVRGPASRSYGVLVAKLAGLPESVLARARTLLEMLESGRDKAGEAGLVEPRRKARTKKPQLELFAANQAPTPAERDVLDTIKNTEVVRMTPLDALSFIARLQDKLK
jgi:DNA mismatch repair protein MutS